MPVPRHPPLYFWAHLMHWPSEAGSHPVLTQILASDGAEVEVNAEIVACVPEVWDGDAVWAADDASCVIIL